MEMISTESFARCMSCDCVCSCLCNCPIESGRAMTTSFNRSAAGESAYGSWYAGGGQ
jgi:hypothetical protein